MAKNVYTPLEGLVTRYKNKLQADPFFVARLQTMALYFIVGVVIFIIVGWIWGYVTRQEVYSTVLAQYPVRAVLDKLEYQLLIERLVMLVCFALAAFVLSGFALRPVRKSAELQKRYIAMVSHELRTPLTVMKNALEVSLRSKDSLTRGKAISVLESNLEEVNRLSNTIQFLVTFSTVTNRNAISDVQELQLDSIIDSITPILNEEAEKRAVVIKIEKDQKAIVKGNSIALQGMLMNIVKNAIYHTPEKGTVTISAQSLLHGSRVVVSDTGTGIAKKDLPYIFQPFYRGEIQAIDGAAGKGVGLGLSIVKELADLHRASVAVASVEGKGSIFTVFFPY